MMMHVLHDPILCSHVRGLFTEQPCLHCWFLPPDCCIPRSFQIGSTASAIGGEASADGQQWRVGGAMGGCILEEGGDNIYQAVSGIRRP